MKLSGQINKKDIVTIVDTDFSMHKTFEELFHSKNYKNLNIKSSFSENDIFDFGIFVLHGDKLNHKDRMLIQNIASKNKLIILSDSKSIELGYELGKLGVHSLYYLENFSIKNLKTLF